MAFNRLEEDVIEKYNVELVYDPTLKIDSTCYIALIGMAEALLPFLDKIDFRWKPAPDEYFDLIMTPKAATGRSPWTEKIRLWPGAGGEQQFSMPDWWTFEEKFKVESALSTMESCIRNFGITKIIIIFY